MTDAVDAAPAAVCFDLDDTLYDYHQYARAGLREVADRLEARTGESYHDELLALYFDESVTEGTFDRLVDRHGLAPDGDEDAVVDDLVEAYHGATDPLDPYPAAERVLSRFADRYELGLITDGHGGRAKLRRLGVEGYFDVVVVGPERDSSKHQREVFDAALAELAGSADETVYIGDDPRVDVRIPKQLGMTTVRLRRGRYSHLEPDDGDEPDAEIDDLCALTAILE